MRVLVRRPRPPPEPPDAGGKSTFPWWQAIPWIIAGAALAFAVYQYWRRRADAAVKKRDELEVQEDFKRGQMQQTQESAEEGYRSILKQELGVVQVVGAHEIANIPVDLLETFVSLDISSVRETDADRDITPDTPPQQNVRAVTPESALMQAFERDRMLLVLGDAGSGKTTLLKYYAMLCLKGERDRDLGFQNPPLPVYLPLREVEFERNVPRPLHECLSTWAEKYHRNISSEVFYDWLSHRSTLILLDGLDEISDLAERRKVCEWIDNAAKGFEDARFVVTSRWTGYYSADVIQIGFPHLTADIRDFSTEQQAQFLRKWFVAACWKETRAEGVPQAEWEARQERRGLDRAQAIIDFLKLPQNKGVQELVAVPMLLQIVAIIWKEHESLPQSRAELYKTALSYLAYYRDRHRGIESPLCLAHTMRVLQLIAFWMQDKKEASDTVLKDALYEKMQPVIDTMKEGLSAREYFEHLRDRAAVLTDSGKDSCTFRHKSFREYLAGVELVEVCKNADRVRQIAAHVGSDWWEEPLRFFMGEVDDQLFDGFMDAVFRCDISRKFNQGICDRLVRLVADASQRRIDSQARCLADRRVGDDRKRYVVYCLDKIGTSLAFDALDKFSQTGPDGAAKALAKEIVARRRATAEPAAKVCRIPVLFRDPLQSFRNLYELNAEYIPIPGGSFTYSVTGKTEKVPDLYFAKYPVTNQRYRLFVNYLADEKAKLREVLPVADFAKGLLASAGETDGFREYLGDDPGSWAQKLKSAYDEEKRFKGDEQPVVGVSWFDASAYCLWLSMLETAAAGVPVEKLGRVYRLPREIEWEWAAGGGVREYPWHPDKGEPTDKLANYTGNVGATTPVGRYPDGATPEGLMDMAGNVWEWMENLHGHKQFPRARSLRGGSWGFYVVDLRCSARGYYGPESRHVNFGFRVVCSQS